MKFSLMIASLFLVGSLYAQEENKVDKLDVLDKQSKDFFKAITGLEKDYLEEQITTIQNKKKQEVQNNNRLNTNPNAPKEEELTQEEIEKNIFRHQNEIARLTSDFTRTKQLKDIRIKSMYSFNGKDYVVLRLDKNSNTSANSELSANIEGRYTRGDSILGHRITSVNVRTKSVKLYKKLDDEFGYYIYLNNYGISVSDLLKINQDKKEETTEKKVKKSSVRESFKSIANKSVALPSRETTSVKMETIVDSTSTVDSTNISACQYTVKTSNLNVRNSTSLEATILRILRKGDRFDIVQKSGEWAQIDTIYKKKSGDVMPVSNQNNWVIITSDYVSSNKSCF